jgi:hypothetical protein
MWHVLWGRVARWHIFKPKIPIWVTFLCLALEDVVVSFVHLVYFMALRYTYIVDIWYVWWLFGIFFPVWYLVPRKIWQSLPQFLSRKVEFNCVITLENRTKNRPLQRTNTIPAIVPWFKIGSRLSKVNRMTICVLSGPGIELAIFRFFFCPHFRWDATSP